MSFQLAIRRWVALPQSPPVLQQLEFIVKQVEATVQSNASEWRAVS